MSLLKTNKSLVPSAWTDLFDADKFFGNRWLEKEFGHSLPAVNIKESDSEFHVDFAAPGFKKGDFKINVEDNVLTISAEKQEEKNEEKERYTRKEFSYSSFSRSFTLPQSVNADKIDAKYTDGILNINIPKKEEAKTQPKKEIKVA